MSDEKYCRQGRQGQNRSSDWVSKVSKNICGVDRNRECKSGDEKTLLLLSTIIYVCILLFLFELYIYTSCVTLLQAFQGQGLMWTVTLCQADSDGDGRTNGEELGDPNCVWMTGLTPTNKATGHPGQS